MQTRGQNSALTSELALRKNMHAEALRAKQASDAAVAQGQQNLQALTARLSEMEAELRVSCPSSPLLASYGNWD